ncbi:MAG: hypothetical protein AAFY88_14505 [Acidobacteriota bacterium]
MAWVNEGPERFPRARRSLYYLLAYLTGLGFGLGLAPARTLDALGATGAYGPVFPRVAGMFLLGLAMITASLIVYRLDVLYLGVVAVRSFFSACFLALSFWTGDPVFLVFFGFVFTGVVLTGACLWLDRRRELGRS